MGTHAATARRWFEEVWVPGGEKTVTELMAPDAMGWMEGRIVKGPADFLDARRQLLAVFPDLKVTVDDVIEQGDKAVVRWSVEATHGGDGLGMPPTNRRVSFRGLTWMEFSGGRMVRGWDAWNLGGLIQSLQV